MEIFDLVTEDDSKIIGTALREECHGNPALIHRAVRIMVFAQADGEYLLLQKRSMSKKVQPGKWDAAVGGHVASGETLLQAAARELAEEIGITLEKEQTLEFFYTIKVRNAFESENITVYKLIHNGPFIRQEEEVEELRFFSLPELKELLISSPEIFTPLLLQELKEHLLCS